MVKKLGLLVSEEGLLYADKLEEILIAAIPLRLDRYAHDVIRADTNLTKEYLDSFSKDGYSALLINMEKLK